jgi:hypothetical protein
MNRKTHIIIHHSVSADNPVLLNLEAIRDWHVKVNGWRDIGYSHVIEQISNKWEVLYGRLPTNELAHEPCLSLNKVGYGICCIGNFDVTVPTPEMLSKLRLLCWELMRTDGINSANVWGHGEAQAAGGYPPEQRKTCPGKLFDLNAFRQSLLVGNPYA